MNNQSKIRNDDDTIPVKPFSLSLIVLTSAGAGLAAGLFISWLFCSSCCMQNNDNVESNNVSTSQAIADTTSRI